MRSFSIGLTDVSIHLTDFSFQLTGYWSSKMYQRQGCSQDFRKGGGKEMSKFVVTPTVSNRLLLRETAAAHPNCTER